MSDSQVQLEAQRWIDSLERKWRLQILSKRFRLDRKTGERREMPLRIRRFAEGIPYACVDEAMRYLLSKAPYRDVVYNGMLLEGEYVPTLTTWKRDDQDVVNGISRTDGTYTLIQDLIDRTYVDRYGIGSSRSCTEEVVSEWTWDSDTIEDIPEENPLQGVTYAIQSVSRNEDGTFNYALVKRTALTQHTPRVATKVTADETVETEAWDNLYGEPPDFVDDKGLPVDIPVAGYTPPYMDGSEPDGVMVPGTRTEVQVAKNDDCTYKVQAVYITDGPARVDPTYLGDTTCLQDTEFEYHWRELEVVDIQSGRQQGVTRAIQNLRREDDGTYSYVVVTRTAKYRHTPETVVRETAEGSTTVETWDNLYGEPGAFTDGTDPVAVPEAGYDRDAHVRVEVQVSQNDDCTYKVQATKAVGDGSDADPDYVASGSCVESVRQVHHWHETEVTDISSRGQGETKAIQNLRREDDGTYSYTVVIRNAVTQDTGDIVHGDSVTERVTVRNVNNVYGEPGYWLMRSGDGVETEMFPPIPEPGVGPEGRVEVQVTRNEDCTYRVQVTATKSKPVCPIEEQDHKTQYKEDTQVRCAGQSAPLGPAPEYGGGLTVTHESQRQPDGTYVNRVSTDQERPVQESTVKVDVGRRGKRVTVVDTNQPQPAPTDSVGVGGSVQVEKTPGGLFNNTVSTWDRSEQVRAGDYCTEDVFHHQHDVTKAGLPSMPDPDFDHVEDSGKDGLVVARRTDMDEEGSISQTVSKNQEILAPRCEESWRIGPHGVIHTVKHRNVDPVAHPELYGTVPNGGVYDRAKIGSELVRTETPGGWYDVTISCADRADNLKVGVGCSKDVFLHTDTAISSADALPEGDAAHVEDAGLTSLPDEYSGLRGVYRSRDARVNSDGTISVTETRNVEIPVSDAQTEDEDTALMTEHTSVDRNQAEPHAASDVTLDGHVLTVKTSSMNKGGSYDVTTRVRTPKFRWWRHVTDTNWRWSVTVWFRNATPENVRALYGRLMDDFVELMEGGSGGAFLGSGAHAFIDDEESSE